MRRLDAFAGEDNIDQKSFGVETIALVSVNVERGINE